MDSLQNLLCWAYSDYRRSGTYPESFGGGDVVLN